MNRSLNGSNIYLRFMGNPLPNIVLNYPYSINWGQASDETEIRFTVDNAVKVVAEWNPSQTIGLGVPNMAVEDGAVVSGGSTTLLPNGVLIPENMATAFTGTTITLMANTNYPWEHASPGMFEGIIKFTAYGANGETSYVTIHCAS